MCSVCMAESVYLPLLLMAFQVEMAVWAEILVCNKKIFYQKVFRRKWQKAFCAVQDNRKTLEHEFLLSGTESGSKEG